jgi:hypothetical protein
VSQVTDIPTTARKALWVEVRDSESGERTVDHYSAPVPRNRAEREILLNRIVPQIYPGAQLRTYGGGVATFVRGMLLIEAHYGAVKEGTELKPVPEHNLQPIADGKGQGSLFAA